MNKKFDIVLQETQLSCINGGIMGNAIFLGQKFKIAGLPPEISRPAPIIAKGYIAVNGQVIYICDYIFQYGNCTCPVFLTALSTLLELDVDVTLDMKITSGGGQVQLNYGPTLSTREESRLRKIWPSTFQNMFSTYIYENKFITHYVDENKS